MPERMATGVTRRFSVARSCASGGESPEFRSSGNALERIEKVGGFDAECPCESEDIYQRNVTFAALDSADIIAMQVR